MKKLFALLLVVALMFTVTALAADPGATKIYEDDDDFDFYITLPEGASIVSEETIDAYTYLDLAIDGYDYLCIEVIIGPDEQYTDLSLSDLNDDDVNAIIGWYTEEMLEPSTEYISVTDGYDYIALNENTKSNDSSEAITLIRGYDIMIYVAHQDYAELNEADAAISSMLMKTVQTIAK